MTKFKSAIITTLYHGVALLFIWLMLMMAYIGANTILPESIYTSQDTLIKLSYSLCKALVSIISLVVMCYPIVNWVADIYGIYSNELSSVGGWIYKVVKTFIVGGVNAVSEQNKDTL